MQGGDDLGALFERAAGLVDKLDDRVDLLLIDPIGQRTVSPACEYGSPEPPGFPLEGSVCKDLASTLWVPAVGDAEPKLTKSPIDQAIGREKSSALYS